MQRETHISNFNESSITGWCSGTRNHYAEPSTASKVSCCVLSSVSYPFASQLLCSVPRIHEASQLLCHVLSFVSVSQSVALSSVSYPRGSQFLCHVLSFVSTCQSLAVSCHLFHIHVAISCWVMSSVSYPCASQFLCMSSASYSHASQLLCSVFSFVSMCQSVALSCPQFRIHIGYVIPLLQRSVQIR